MIKQLLIGLFLLQATFLYGKDLPITVTMGGSEAWDCRCYTNDFSKKDTLEVGGYNNAIEKHLPFMEIIIIKCFGTGLVFATVTADLTNKADPSWGIETTGDLDEYTISIYWVNPIALELYKALEELKKQAEKLSKEKIQ